jgi:hypothetical protein
VSNKPSCFGVGKMVRFLSNLKIETIVIKDPPTKNIHPGNCKNDGNFDQSIGMKNIKNNNKRQEKH